MPSIKLAIAALAAAMGLQACAYDTFASGPGRYGDYAYDGQAFHGFEGEGAELLEPWLADTEEGQRIVRLGFQGAADGHVDEATADRINIWFRRYADTDRDLCLTDEEIRVALIQASRDRDGESY